jgi:hypothetical protein
MSSMQISSFKNSLFFIHIINLISFIYHSSVIIFINNLAALSHENMFKCKMNFKFHLSIYSKMLTTFNSKDISEFEKVFNQTTKSFIANVQQHAVNSIGLQISLINSFDVKNKNVTMYDELLWIFVKSFS